MFWKNHKSRQLKLFVSIGAGLNQIPLIIEAKKLGFHVIGVDVNIQAPGFIHCDLKIQESIENYDAIYKKLSELLVDGDICGILTRSFGTAIKTTSYIADKFHIPFLPFQGSEWYMNKKIMKSFLVDNGILTPQQFTITKKTNLDNLRSIAFPIIAKPTTGHAKIDVNYFENKVELKSFINSREGIKNIIFEKYVRGNELIAAGIIHKKKFHLVEITDKETTPLPNFVDLMHVTPSKHLDLFDEIKEIGQKITDIFSITTAPLIMEFVVDEKGELFLIEAVPEFGGEFLSDILIPESSGYNILNETIKAMTDTGFRPPALKKTKKAVAVKYIIGKNGKFASFNPEGPTRVEGIIFSRIFKDIGSNIKQAKTNFDRIGVVIAKGRIPEEAISLAEQAAVSYNIRIKNT